jgi:hypothetical protein
MMLFYFRIATLIYYTLPAIIITSPSTRVQILALPLMRMIAKQISGKVNQICGRCSWYRRLQLDTSNRSRRWPVMDATPFMEARMKVIATFMEELRVQRCTRQHVREKCRESGEMLRGTKVPNTTLHDEVLCRRVKHNLLEFCTNKWMSAS